MSEKMVRLPLFRYICHKSNFSAMNDKEIIERIKHLISELGYKQADFARKIDMDPSNLSKYLNGRLPINDSVTNKVIVNMGVSKQWLLEGTDIPFPKSMPVAEVTLSASPSRQHIGVPVYDIDVTAGMMPRDMMFASERIVGYIDLPTLNPRSRVVTASGDSMAPVIRSGDMLAIRELSTAAHIVWGSIYVVLLDDYRLVKYVRRHQNPALVILHSENPNYDDMEIPRADIRELMLVESILHIDIR